VGCGGGEQLPKKMVPHDRPGYLNLTLKSGQKNNFRAKKSVKKQISGLKLSKKTNFRDKI
jgi:hypothetical protein